MHSRLFRSLNFSTTQKKNMARVWCEWQRRKRSLDKQQGLAVAALNATVRIPPLPPTHYYVIHAIAEYILPIGDSQYHDMSPHRQLLSHSHSHSIPAGFSRPHNMQQGHASMPRHTHHVAAAPTTTSTGMGNSNMMGRPPAYPARSIAPSRASASAQRCPPLQLQGIPGTAFGTGERHPLDATKVSMPETSSGHSAPQALQQPMQFTARSPANHAQQHAVQPAKLLPHGNLNSSADFIPMASEPQQPFFGPFSGPAPSHPMIEVCDTFALNPPDGCVARHSQHHAPLAVASARHTGSHFAVGPTTAHTAQTMVRVPHPQHPQPGGPFATSAMQPLGATWDQRVGRGSYSGRGNSSFEEVCSSSGLVRKQHSCDVGEEQCAHHPSRHSSPSSPAVSPYHAFGTEGGGGMPTQPPPVERSPPLRDASATGRAHSAERPAWPGLAGQCAYTTGSMCRALEDLHLVKSSDGRLYEDFIELRLHPSEIMDAKQLMAIYSEHLKFTCPPADTMVLCQISSLQSKHEEVFRGVEALTL